MPRGPGANLSVPSILGENATCLQHPSEDKCSHLDTDTMQFKLDGECCRVMDETDTRTSVRGVEVTGGSDFKSAEWPGAVINTQERPVSPNTHPGASKQAEFIANWS